MLRTKLLVLVALACLQGCAALSPASKLTKLDIRLDASEQLNPDVNGRPSPVVVRLMELRHPVAFKNADFFSLYQQPRETLMPDLVAVEEIELRPGETRELKLSANPESRYLGVIVAYRDLTESEWRTTIALKAKRINSIVLELEENGLVKSAISARKKD